MSREFTREAVMKFLPAPFSWKWCKCLLRSLIHSKISNLAKYRGSSRKIFTAHYACRNATVNLTPVTGTTNGFIFQIINSLIESWGVRLTCLDCNRFYLPLKKQEEKLIKFTFGKTSGTVTRDRKNTLAKYIVAE